MKKFILFLGAAIATMVSVSEASAQIKVGEGQVSVALESNSSYYAKDEILEDIGLSEPHKRIRGDFGSNDYLKVDYNKGRFSAGVQVDAYLPGLYGYDAYTYQQKDSKNTSFLTKYIQWEDENWGVRVGDIFDQFGNGLIFRSYEDRALGFNNSLSGGRLHYNINGVASIKMLAGKPRLYDIRTDNYIYGADLSVTLSEMMGWNNGILSVEGSYVGRYDSDISEYDYKDYETGETKNQLNGQQSLNMVSGRLNFEYAGFSLRSEYATKLNEDLHNPSKPMAKGNVLYLDLGYNYKRFSASASFRRTENMTTALDNRIPAIGGGNIMNYLPLLTRQHTYSLANLNPYRGSSVHTGGEIGGQVDLYYSLRNPKARGKYWNFHANFSMFNTLDHIDSYTGEQRDSRNVWVDFNFDVERQWNKKVKTTFFYSFQRWDEEINHFDSAEPLLCASHIFVGDVTYKFNKKHSMRFEAQYLSSDDYEGDWVAATIEYNFAPKFSFYVSDMWNCEEMKPIGNYGGNYFPHNSIEEQNIKNNAWGDTHPKWEDPYKHELLHYYQIGMSYTHNSLRAQLSYGRNRAGFVCSGGVCRFQPAYTGLNLAITLSF